MNDFTKKRGNHDGFHVFVICFDFIQPYVRSTAYISYHCHMDTDHSDIPWRVHASSVLLPHSRPYWFRLLLQPAHALPSALPVHDREDEWYPPDTLTELIHIVDMIHPLAVDHLQQYDTLQLTELLDLREFGLFSFI